MKYLVITLLFLASLDVTAQNVFESINCNIEMTIKEILRDGFEKDCTQLKGKTIISFQIKVPKHKTISIQGNLLNDKASDYISKLKVGDKITIFNIKVKSNISIQPIVITIED